WLATRSAHPHHPRAAGRRARRSRPTNRQVGRALGIAEKTVEVHVHHVIAKLGAQSRTEVAAWVVARQGRPARGSPDTRS
ncbi:MAG: LuxR C-terminal-related transcriptional regulator, partial [Pseudonocardia sp.]|nr:LuxR C-terminal-related transcriptional regulator [Pseudonocardia sp.]